MPYTQFNVHHLKEEFGVRFMIQTFFDRKKVQRIKPSAWLIEAIKRAKDIGFSSEKSRSEFLVAPILGELNVINNNKISIYSGLNFNVDDTKGLNGECDFILSFASFGKLAYVVEQPVFFIVEAKKQDLDLGLTQCAAQLIGAKIFNEQKKTTQQPFLYGCTTTGTEWRFLKYDTKNNQMLVDRDHYFIVQTDLLLGILQNIVLNTKKEFDLR